jgi:hypothetical protein
MDEQLEVWTDFDSGGAITGLHDRVVIHSSFSYESLVFKLYGEREEPPVCVVSDGCPPLQRVMSYMLIVSLSAQSKVYSIPRELADRLSAVGCSPTVPFDGREGLTVVSRHPRH